MFLPKARPMKVVLKSRPYFGVFVFCLRALKSAFSAPRIWMVEAGYLERVASDPEWEMSLAAMVSPIKLVRFGATISILPLR